MSADSESVFLELLSFILKCLLVSFVQLWVGNIFLAQRAGQKL